MTRSAVTGSAGRPSGCVLVAQCGLEGVLEGPTERQDLQVPLGVVVDVVEPAVVELVAAPQREVQVVVGQRVESVEEPRLGRRPPVHPTTMP
jgi:hypothetical protein